MYSGEPVKKKFSTTRFSSASHWIEPEPGGRLVMLKVGTAGLIGDGGGCGTIKSAYFKFAPGTNMSSTVSNFTTKSPRVRPNGLNAVSPLLNVGSSPVSTSM